MRTLTEKTQRISPIQWAVARTRPISRRDLNYREECGRKAQKIVSILDALADARGNLFGCEWDARFQLEKAVQEITNANKRITEQLARADRLALFQQMGYRRFPASIVSRTNQQGLPLFALFSIKSGFFKIETQVRIQTEWARTPEKIKVVSVSTTVRPEREGLFAKLYQRTIRTLERLARKKKRTLTLSAEFSGVFPSVVRQKIQEATEYFGEEDIFIVAEVKNRRFTESEPTRIIPGDPIVIGWDGTEFWYITHFDLTPLEEYVLQVEAMVVPHEKKN